MCSMYVDIIKYHIFLQCVIIIIRVCLENTKRYSSALQVCQQPAVVAARAYRVTL